MKVYYHIKTLAGSDWIDRGSCGYLSEAKERAKKFNAETGVAVRVCWGSGLILKFELPARAISASSASPRES